MINEEHADQLLGRDMLDREGNRIGEITQVFVDDRTGEPTWVTVKTGWFGLSQSFVPLNKVQWAGEQVRAAYDTATVKDSPRFATDEPLTALDEDTLHAHYGLADPATGPHRQSAFGDTAAPARPLPPPSRPVPAAGYAGTTPTEAEPIAPASVPPRYARSAARTSRGTCWITTPSTAAWPDRPEATTWRSPNPQPG